MNFLVQCELMNNTCRSHSDLLASEAQAGERRGAQEEITYIWGGHKLLDLHLCEALVALYFVEFLL